MISNSIRRTLPWLGLVLLVGCSNVPRLVSEYKIDVQQGNVLTQDMVAQLKPGMTRDQVRFVLGTPTLTDMFHQQRWDYPYRYLRGVTGEVTARRFSVYFDERGLLQRVEGDVDEASVAELTTPVARTQLVDLGGLPEGGVPLPPPEEPGFFSRMLNMIGL